MRAPSSSILPEIYLQHIEHTHLPFLTQKHKLVNYFRYVDDILLIYDSHHTNIQAILDDFNSLHPNLQFTEEMEKDNQLN
jgi:ABC-type lipoprotein export system ATPase subunit